MDKKHSRLGFWAAVVLLLGGTGLLTYQVRNNPEPVPQKKVAQGSLLDAFRGTEAEAAANLDGNGSVQLVSGAAPLAYRTTPRYEEEGLSLEDVSVTEQGDNDLEEKIQQLALQLPDLSAPKPLAVDSAELDKEVENLQASVVEPNFDHDAVWVEHQVAKGETLSDISAQYGVKTATILDVNGLTNAAKLKIGQVLILPKGETFATEAKAERLQRIAHAKAVEEQAQPISYQDYTVVGGDSLWTIASKFDLSVDSVLGVNELKNPDMLRPGAKLRIPNQDGITTKVGKSDSLASLAKKYDISIKAIARANGVNENAKLKAGQTLFLPGASQAVEAYKNASTGGGFVNKAPTVARANPESTGRFIWPLRGRINSPFGWRHHPILKKRWFHTGIDIKGNRGAPIYAARAGQVIYAGWMNGYGQTVVVRHDSKYTTLYAHASRILVKKGQQVSQGQSVALVGSSGRSTGPHLHFEVRINNKPTNPMSYLR